MATTTNVKNTAFKKATSATPVRTQETTAPAPTSGCICPPVEVVNQKAIDSFRKAICSTNVCEILTAVITAGSFDLPDSVLEEAERSATLALEAIAQEYAEEKSGLEKEIAYLNSELLEKNIKNEKANRVVKILCGIIADKE